MSTARSSPPWAVESDAKRGSRFRQGWEERVRERMLWVSRQEGQGMVQCGLIFLMASHIVILTVLGSQMATSQPGH